MKQSMAVLLTFVFNFGYSQPVELLNENFDNGIPAGWSHCSGNWEATPQWAVDSGALRESSGPYFGGVLNGVVLPPVDLTSITNPLLEFDLALAEIDTNVQFSVWHTTDSVCTPVWDTVKNQYFLGGWTLLSTHEPNAVAASNSWEPSNGDYKKVSIDLSPFSSATVIRFCLVSDYMNVSCNGVWYLDNVRIFSDSTTGIPGNHVSAFRLVPNPASKVVRLVSDMPLKNATLKITDLTGKVVFEQSSDSATGEIAVSGYKPGMYLVQFISGKRVSINKLFIN